MKNKLIEPKPFRDEKPKTEKHDQFLFKLSKESALLAGLIQLAISKRISPPQRIELFIEQLEGNKLRAYG